MDLKIGCWNVRGLNNPEKISMVSQFIKRNNLACMAILETRAQKEQEKKIWEKIQRSWKFVGNNSRSINGRIWVGWDPSKISVEETVIKDQVSIL